jgi:hypothetical protein
MATKLNTNSLFEYPPIDSLRREIRLFSLDRTDEDGGLQGSLETVSLDQDAEYVALSYVWGTDCAKDQVYVKDSCIEIRPNLSDFLTTIPTRNMLGTKIFIDAMCINQMDGEEKASQIQLMCDIYSGARKVIAWLGKPSIGEDASDEDIRTSEFWSRLWIVQEIILAQSLEIWYGNVIVSVDEDFMPQDFEGEARALELNRHLDFYHLTTKDTPLGAAILQLGERRGVIVDAKQRRLDSNYIRSWMILKQRYQMRAGSPTGDRPSLRKALTAFGTQLSTKRHDKIFGLLGLAESHIYVDYKTSILELYLRTLIEGLYEIAAASQTEGSEGEKHGESSYEEHCAQFHNVCAATLGLGLEGAVSLTTVRAMQHCGVLPLSQNLYFGVGKIVANYYKHGSLSQFLSGDHPVMYKMWYWYILPLAMIYPFIPCTVVQYARKYQRSFGPAGDPERSFEE